MIRISSKREGFRRCGIAHSKAPVEFPDDKFSKEEIAILEAESMLIVEHITAKAPPLEDMTVGALKGLLDELKVSYAGNAVKAVLIDLVKTNTAKPPEE
ncbi:MAG: HI1506-related protein [Spirochaetales bacterium]|jgi:hypothetical protein|nr:HI1506-related protein [Spirochaetales bacterium]